MSQNVPAKENSLTPRQLEALPYLAATSSLSAGTTLADISRRTLHRWLEDDDFREKLQQLRSEAADLARTELQGLMLKSVEVLAGSMDDPYSGVRLRAARAWRSGPSTSESWPSVFSASTTPSPSGHPKPPNDDRFQSRPFARFQSPPLQKGD